MHQVVIIHNHPIHYKQLLFTEMVRLGLQFEVFYVSPQSSNRIQPITVERGGYAWRYCTSDPYESHSKWRTIRSVWSGLRERKPALVIISGYYDVAGWTAWLWSVLHSRPKVLWNESNAFDWKRVWYKEALKRLYMKRVDYAHVYGISNADYLEQLGLDRSKIVVKRAVADAELFRPLPRPTVHLDRKRTTNPMVSESA